jgi:peroxiredoxin
MIASTGYGRRSVLVLITALLSLLLVLACTACGVADDESKEIVPRGTIFDLDKKPVEGAQVTLHRWDGVMSPALQTATTDAEGKFEFAARPNDTYYYVLISKTPFATIEQIVQEDGPVKATLRSAVDSWIEVHNVSGEPLKGARITNITIRSDENSGYYISRGWEHLFGIEFSASDESGRLKLPPLPEGAIVDIRVDHPQWAQAKLSNAKVTSGHLDNLYMPTGVMTTFEFVADSRTPMTLDGITCEVLLLSQRSNSVESLLRLPLTITGDAIKICVHPVNYRMFRLKAPGVTITPMFDQLTIAREPEKKVRFLVRKNVKVAGRVIHLDGTPHKGARVWAKTENLSPDGVTSVDGEMSYCADAETEADGKFSIELPPGHNRIQVDAEGHVADRAYADLDIHADVPTEIPDFIIERLESIRGQVIDQNGQTVSGAIVRVRHPMVGDQPQATDADGKFKISLYRIPFNYETQQRQYELDVVAFVTDQPLMGVTRIDLHRTDSLTHVNIELRPDSSPDALLSMEDNQWSAARMKKLATEGKLESHPAGEPGRPAPELDGVAWFNTDGRSLKDFRGRYVLLDFWFIGCGPCHGDLPSVKLVHERFAKHGVTVIGVHDNSSTPEVVQEHCRKHGIEYPTVVDQTDGRILRAYHALGVQGFPSYILLGPDGTILANDNSGTGPNLRSFKLELVRKYLLAAPPDQ